MKVLAILQYELLWNWSFRGTLPINVERTSQNEFYPFIDENRMKFAELFLITSCQVWKKEKVRNGPYTP